MATTSSSVLDLLQSDCLELLLALAAYDALTAKPWSQFESREQLHFHNVTARESETMLALRVCRFDDEANNQVCFRTAFKDVKEHLPPATATEIQNRIKSFRTAINPIKTTVRNKYGAHRDGQTKVPQDPSAWAIRIVDSTASKDGKYRSSSAQQIDIVGIDSIRARASEIVKIVDLLSGTPKRYLMKSGSLEPEVDLRVLCEIEVGR
ncbi:hypothetical protein ACIP9X_13035 [Arthrobacter sp. NPDC093125]|uniref:hypothetical protein n=1 Tax=Arthrobacter sp. NPDC093125 TaxID=3363944 RepID=UPI0038104C75